MAKQLMWISGNDADLKNYAIFADDSVIVERIRALKVGQGNAVAIDTDDLDVAFYCDVGSGCFWNAKTAPSAAKLGNAFEFEDEPVILLTHWDGDHWYAGGVTLLDDAKKCRWLAPRQEVSPMHQKLAATLKSKLRLWPKSRKNSLQIVTGNGFVQIDKCTGDERNYSGLAVLIVRLDLDDGHQMVVLPGDAGYQHIPALDASSSEMIDAKVIGLMATHHGSKTHLENVPRPHSLGGTIVYSYGTGNGYGHPAPEAVAEYESQGWAAGGTLDVYDTTADEAAMTFFEEEDD